MDEIRKCKICERLKSNEVYKVQGSCVDLEIKKIHGETKRTQIYVLNKKEFEKLEMEDINTVLSKLTFLKNLWYQNLFLKNISEIESFMSFNDSFKYLNGIN